MDTSQFDYRKKISETKRLHDAIAKLTTTIYHALDKGNSKCA